MIEELQSSLHRGRFGRLMSARFATSLGTSCQIHADADLQGCRCTTFMFPLILFRSSMHHTSIEAGPTYVRIKIPGQLSSLCRCPPSSGLVPQFAAAAADAYAMVPCPQERTIIQISLRHKCIECRIAGVTSAGVENDTFYEDS